MSGETTPLRLVDYLFFFFFIVIISFLLFLLVDYLFDVCKS